MKKPNGKLLSLLMCAALTLGLFTVACDSPREQATEERIEDAGEAAGMEEDAAEEMAEERTEDPLTDTTLTTDTMASDTVLTDTAVTTDDTANPPGSY